MEIRNGQKILYEPYLFRPNKELKVWTYTDNHTVEWDQAGMVLVMNTTNDKTFTLPAGSTPHIGTEFHFTNINTGKLTIDPTGNDTIHSAAATKVLYSDTDTIASVTVRLVSATHWQIAFANGTWSVTV